MSQAIEIHQIWKYYGDYPALRDCTLTIAQASCCALLGRNGAGKTTLLRLLAGLSDFQRGRIRLFGTPPRDSETRRRTGFLGHGIGVYDDLTAQENLNFFARIAGIADSKHAVQSWLRRVGLDRVAKMPVRQFSRGMRQRLALARAFIHEPTVLLLDEPFTSLDDRAIAMLSELLVEARQRRATIVLSTHQLREALAIASDVALMENGKLRFAGKRTQEMLDDPGLLYRIHTELGAA
jgi:heme ABC exporter ATP-binding subunit CcmA